MATEKTFDKADLLRFFVSGDEAMVGKITVITPSRTLFGETDTMRYPVAAKTEALWCEKYRLAILVQSVDFPDGGRTHLPKNHPLRQDPTVQVKYGGNSAQLVRWAMEMADAWHGVVRWMLPSDPIDLTKRTTEPEAPIDQDHTPTGQSVDDMFDDGEATA